MRFPYRVKNLLNVQKNFDYMGSRVREMRGPYIVASGNLTPGGQSGIVFTHNLGIEPTRYHIVAEQMDGGWGYYIQWIVVTRLRDSFQVNFYNSNTVTTAQLVLNAYVVVD